MTGDSLTIKKTLSVFLQKSVEEIDETTPLKISSIMKHRMFAALSEKGVQVRDSHMIRTVGDLLRKHKILHHALDEPMTPPPPPHEAPAVRAPVPVTTDGIAPPLAMNIQMGVDLEDVENLPEVPDVRKDPFYTATFSPATGSEKLFTGLRGDGPLPIRPIYSTPASNSSSTGEPS